LRAQIDNSKALMGKAFASAITANSRQRALFVCESFALTVLATRNKI